MSDSTPMVVVTGSTGFIGSAIVSRLLACGVAVHGVARRSGNTACEDIEPQAAFTAADLSAGLPLLSQRSAESHLRGTKVATLIHAAGLAHRRASGAEHEVATVRVTENAVRWASELGARRCVLVSSVAAKGLNATNCIRDANQPVVRTDYGEAKFRAEQRAMQLADQHGMELCVLRLATAYGRGDPGNIGRLARAISRRRFVGIGSGKNSKSLIHVQDAAAIIAAAALAPKTPTTSGRTIDVATGTYEMRTIVDLLASAVGRSSPFWVPLPFESRLVSLLADPQFVSLVRHGFGGVARTWFSDERHEGSVAMWELPIPKFHPKALANGLVESYSDVTRVVQGPLNRSCR